MITMKIGRHEYIITENDRFLDNGACVQLMTQSKEKAVWGQRSQPKLSKFAVKSIKESGIVEYSTLYRGCTLFGIK